MSIYLFVVARFVFFAIMFCISWSILTSSLLFLFTCPINVCLSRFYSVRDALEDLARKEYVQRARQHLSTTKSVVFDDDKVHGLSFHYHSFGQVSLAIWTPETGRQIRQVQISLQFALNLFRAILSWIKRFVIGVSITTLRFGQAKTIIQRKLKFW